MPARSFVILSFSEQEKCPRLRWRQSGFTPFSGLFRWYVRKGMCGLQPRRRVCLADESSRDVGSQVTRQRVRYKVQRDI